MASSFERNTKKFLIAVLIAVPLVFAVSFGVISMTEEQSGCYDTVRTVTVEVDGRQASVLKTVTVCPD